MKKTKIKVIYSSHLTDEENLIYERHVSETIGCPHDIVCYHNFNEYSLTQVYNRAIDENHSEDSIMVFSHNDIEFDTKDWGKIILKHFNNKGNDYQILGVAGVESIYSGCWWLKEDKMNFPEMIGIVNHDNGIRRWESRYSESFYGIKPVCIIDGLFMAVDTSNIEHRFDESFKGYHFYDLSFVFPNVLDGCNAGVISDVRITHKSIGQTNQEWEKNKNLFEKMYHNDIPFKIKEYL